MNFLLEAPAQFVLFLCSDQECYLAGLSVEAMSQSLGNIQYTFIKCLLSSEHCPGHWDAAVDMADNLLPSRSLPSIGGNRQ